MGILERAENLAKKIGKDTGALWAEFEAYVEGKHAAQASTTESQTKAADAVVDAEATTKTDAPAEVADEAETKPQVV